LLLGGGLAEGVAGGYLFEVEEFEEAVDGVAGCGFEGGVVVQVEARVGLVELGGEPGHFGSVGGGFLGDDDMDVGGVA